METLGLIWAGLAAGLGGIGAGIGETLIASATMTSILRNPDLKSKLMILMILFIALDETVAIYGLVIALSIIGLHTDVVAANAHTLIAAALAVGLPGLVIGAGEGFVARTAIDCIGKNGELQSNYMILTILGMALIESAAIYGLVVAMQLLSPLQEQSTALFEAAKAALGA